MSTSPNSRFGPPLGDPGAADERQRLEAANEAFTKRLAAALQSGRETPAGLLATAPEPKFFHPWKANRRGLP
jgi:hypothetical protein